MDKELFDIKIKRCFAQYEYLEKELIETEYLFNIYRQKFIEEYYGGNIPVEELKQPTVVEEGSEEQPKVEQPEKSPILKKMFKSLSLKTHPDKTGGDDTLFISVKKAFNEGNIFKLLTIATKMDVDMSEFTKDSLEIYEQNIKDTQEKIENYKKRAAWVWAFANDEQKEDIRRSL
jgi:hypothetical protein